jgi:hypothetical protein
MFSLPYSCGLNYKLGERYADLVIFKKRIEIKEELSDGNIFEKESEEENKKFSDRDIFLVVEMKRDVDAEGGGEDQVITYSRHLLNSCKGRFLVLSMLCDIEKFTFYCTICINGCAVLIQLGESDYFSYGSNGAGLLKLLYILNLPWPVYGTMITVDKDGIFQILKQEKFLGCGSSAEVYEYKDNKNKSVAVKFFKSGCEKQFFKEVEIYSSLSGLDISLEMLWFDEKRLIICIDGVKTPISFSFLSQQQVEQLFFSLRAFHDKTNHVHRDLYHMNILGSVNDRLYLNDFGLAVINGNLEEIKGNLYFASDKVLLSKEGYKIVYEFSDDLYSLTFSLIFLFFSLTFTEGFEELRDLEHIDRISIYNTRKSIINRMPFRNAILEALNAASTANYDHAKDCILKLMFPNSNK